MTLSRDLGIPIDILQEQVSAKQFAEYKAHYSLDPPLAWKMLYGFASICCVLANINRGRREAPYKIDDFLLKFEPKQEFPIVSSKMSNRERVTAKLKTWVAGLSIMGDK